MGKMFKQAKHAVIRSLAKASIHMSVGLLGLSAALIDKLPPGERMRVS